jgi:hypothetical protein
VSSETTLNIALSLWDGTYNTSYTTVNCPINGSNLELDCSLDVEMITGSTLYYSIWLVSNSMVIDTITN